VLEPFAAIAQNVQSIVAAPDYLRDAIRGTLLARIFPSLPHIAVAGKTPVPDAEVIMALDPEVVFAWRGMTDSLQRIGFKNIIDIEYTQADPRFGIDAAWMTIGQAVGQSEHARRLLSDFRKEMAFLASYLPAANGKPVRVAIIISEGESWKLGGRDFYLNRILAQAGATNVAQRALRTSQVDVEQLLAYDPDVLLFPQYATTQTPDEVFGIVKWESLRAVARRCVYLMPYHALFNGPVDDPLLVAWLMEILHPDEMPRVTRPLYRESYARVYGYSVPDTELDNALLIQQNRHSRGYDRFIDSPFGR
jgi:iron complex transport system substrate-binding protein